MYAATSYAHVDSYARACRVLERRMVSDTGKPRTAGPYGYCLNPSRNQGSQMVRRLANNAIAFRLHNTDIITYHDDDSIDVQCWASVSTSNVFNSLSPATVRMDSHSQVFVETPNCKKVYSGRLSLHPSGDGRTWNVDETGRLKFSYYTADAVARRRARKARNYRTFRDVVTMTAMHLGLEHVAKDRTSASYQEMVRIDQQLIDCMRDMQFSQAVRLLPIRPDKRQFAFGRPTPKSVLDRIDWTMVEYLIDQAGEVFTEAFDTEMSAHGFEDLRRLATRQGTFGHTSWGHGTWTKD